MQRLSGSAGSSAALILTTDEERDVWSGSGMSYFRGSVE
jgi:hypothetical protein